MRHSIPQSSFSSKTGQPVSRAGIARACADEIGDREASVLVRVVARSHGYNVEEMFHHSRSRAPVAATRQLAMYLMHVVLGRSLTQVGRFFQRDRTTVSYACMRVEDLREDPQFDAEVSKLEQAIEFIVGSATMTEQYLAGLKLDE